MGGAVSSTPQGAASGSLVPSLRPQQPAPTGQKGWAPGVLATSWLERWEAISPSRAVGFSLP